MSILIKGAKPPSGCRWCYFNDDSKCVLIVGCDFDDTNGTKRRKDCPLVELPDHGDLIDRDALIKCLRDYACKPCKEYGADKNGDRCAWCSFDDAFARIEKAKKVIPAERSEDD